jgi:hypothetical protein
MSTRLLSTSLAAAALTALAMSACSDDSSVSPAPSVDAGSDASRAAEVDAAVEASPPPAPVVATTSPLDGRVGVGTAAVLRVTFSRAVNASTVSVQKQPGACSGSVQISTDDFQSCLGAGVSSADKTTFEIRGAVDAGVGWLTAETRYFLRVTSAVTSDDGAAVAPYTMGKGFFTTRFAEDAKILFESSRVTGGFGGAVGGDAVCTATPGKPVGVVRAKAILADPVASTPRVACSTPNCAGPDNKQSDWVLSPAQHYVRFDGAFLFTTDARGIYVGTPASGLANLGLNFWDAIDANWTTITTHNCSSWTSSTAATTSCAGTPTADCGAVGWDAGGGSWLRGGALPCSFSQPLACAEQ